MSLVLEFVSCVVKNLVNVPEEVMDDWVQKPKDLQKALTDALCPSKENSPCLWREEDGVIYFEVTSDGTTGPQWIERLENKGFRLSKWAKDVLNHPDFESTSGTTYRIAVLKGTLFTDSNRITKKIRVEAEERRKFERPNAEVACLIREMFSDEELEQMGLWGIAVFHEPIKAGGDPGLLTAHRDDGGRWLSAYCDGPDDRWDSGYGFAFLVSQVSSN